MRGKALRRILRDRSGVVVTKTPHVKQGSIVSWQVAPILAISVRQGVSVRCVAHQTWIAKNTPMKAFATHRAASI
jgi:hypothetical protein